MARPEVADTRPTFLIHHAELLGELKLQDKGIEKSGLRYYTFNDLRPMLSEIGEQGTQAAQVKAEEQSTYQKQVLKLANAVVLYRRLKYTLQPEGAEDWGKTLTDVQTPGGSEHGREAVLQQFREMDLLGYVLVIPPLGAETTGDGWQTAGSALIAGASAGQLHPATVKLAAITAAYRQEKVVEFNRAVDDYRSWLQSSFSKELQ